MLSVRCGGEHELTAGRMGDHLTSKGIAVQCTVAYAHQQNGKSEQYIRTIEEGGQALLADAGLPMSFWLDAVLTRQYLVNCLPTSTLPLNTTPFKVITQGRKPDLSHLRVWGCDCYVAVPHEVHSKAGPKRFQVIFVGYEEHRIGWWVHDISGKYSFSNDVIFNENLSGHLGILRPLSPSAPTPPSLPPRPLRDQPRLRTSASHAYDEVLRLKALRAVERQCAKASTTDLDALYGGAYDLSLSLDTIDDFSSFVASFPLLDQVVVESELDILWDFLHSSFLVSSLFPSSSVFSLTARRSFLIYLKFPLLFPRRLLDQMLLCGFPQWTGRSKVLLKWGHLRRWIYQLVQNL